MSTRPLPARLAAQPADFARLGLAPDAVAPWEDGRRTSGGPGTYEWWYFDAHLDDGAKVVIVFYTKPVTDVGRPLTPQVAFTLDRPDGTHLERTATLPPAAFAAATDHC